MNLSLLKDKLGVDAAIVYSVGSRLIQALSQLFALYLISNRLSPVEQGYYYTFQSVVALQILFELGMGSVLVQVVSHEAAKTDLSNGSTVYSPTLGSLIRFVVRWYSVAGFLYITVLAPVGIVFFSHGSKHNDSVNWLLPWIGLVVVSAGGMLFQALTAILEGLGRIKEAIKYRAIYTTTMGFGLIAALALKAGLYSSFIGITIGVGAASMTCLWNEAARLISIWKNSDDTSPGTWWKAIWGFQWRMAVSNISGYAIFQFTTPMLFVSLGAIYAGQYGMIQQVVNGISGISMAWVATKQALWGRFAAGKDYENLDRSYQETSKKALLVNVALAMCFLVALEFFRFMGMKIGNRFPEIGVCMVLFVCSAINQGVFAKAIYIRAHKEEPIMLNSVCSAIFVATSSLALSRFGLLAVALGYLFNCIFFGHVWVGWIFRQKITRRKLETTLVL